MANSKRFCNTEFSMFKFGCPMSRRPYAAPCTEIVLIDECPVMVKASPGVGSEWNEGDPIDAKSFFDNNYLPSDFKDPWEE